MKMGANDTSGQELHSALKNRSQTKFLRTFALLVLEVWTSSTCEFFNNPLNIPVHSPVNSIFSKNSGVIFANSNFKICLCEQMLQMDANDASGQGIQLTLKKQASN